MRARNHIIVSAATAIGFQAVTHSWAGSVGCFLSGVLIDVDHHLEYLILRKKFPFRYKDLVNFCDYSPENKVYLFFHSYEYLLALWLLIYFLHLGFLWIGVAWGLTIHIILDQYTNPIKPLFYFMTYRIKNRFEKTAILTPAYYQRRK